ncbi:uncharacterized protein LOC123706686 [Pieris brassicae]|uniref:COMM domain-containing protein n=1 Tax=Pieris brassicae TaxID=7116 RepID=A0A9P0X991_PIEBR|nr:uncharacterized protein LOC123706686 [Pieris brassicae]CAH4021755.1 unnamed protein product [Pieris brassicae]
MESNWIKVSPSLSNGLSVVNALDETKFEQFLKRIVMKLRAQETDNIFSEDEKTKLEKIFKVESDQLFLSIKTIIYIFKKIFKYIFMPSDLKIDLTKVGLKGEKADIFVKIWSAETNNTLTELTNKGDQFDDDPDFSWKLNAEISSIYHKKCKVPKAYLTINGVRNDLEVELTHPELQSIFLQIESIQNELDNLILP